MPDSSNTPFPGADDPNVQAYRLMRVEKLVESIAQDISEMKLDAASRPAPCPRPGLCIEHEQELAELRVIVEQGRGAWKLASVVGAIIGAIGSFVGIQIFIK